MHIYVVSFYILTSLVIHSNFNKYVLFQKFPDPFGIETNNRKEYQFLIHLKIKLGDIYLILYSLVWLIKNIKKIEVKNPSKKDSLLNTLYLIPIQ